MNHHATLAFWRAYDSLPAPIRTSADRCFKRLKAEPFHPSLHFKSVGRFWSVRVGLRYRALAVRTGDDIIWFWIGSHAEYNRLLQG
ncbi:hypothetical protein [Consotaella aegiceratis]|uniref:ParE family toxin-like protein n=1 Tax=Consotaella aegiceratis TaxID=3097961 RepID=UPI002F421387